MPHHQVMPDPMVMQLGLIAVCIVRNSCERVVHNWMLHIHLGCML